MFREHGVCSFVRYLCIIFCGTIVESIGVNKIAADVNFAQIWLKKSKKYCLVTYDIWTNWGNCDKNSIFEYC